MIEVQRLDAALTIWSRYDPAVKADLFSTALAVGPKIFLIDPIALGDDDPPIGGAVTGIVITNANHLRASAEFSAKFSAPIYAMREANAPGARELRDGEVLADELRIIAIEGAAPGEIALFLPRDQGLLIVGDALINFGSNGFTFLPAKYCSDSKRMRKSLSKLLALNFERMIFAHGTPIMSKARDRLATLIADGP
jgi:glyoxylase-like metal-dependent hydrolase (beta-lactamase superfamily II)